MIHLISIHCYIAISISHRSINQSIKRDIWDVFSSRSTNNHYSSIQTTLHRILYLSFSRSPSSPNITSARITRGKNKIEVQRLFAQHLQHISTLCPPHSLVRRRFMLVIYQFLTRLVYSFLTKYACFYQCRC